MSWTKNDFLQDLKILNRLLSKYDFSIIGNQLNNLESLLESDLETEDWSHVLEDVEISIDESIAGTLPIDVECFHFYITLHFIIDHSVDFSLNDPFYNGKINFKNHRGIDAYTFQFFIEGHSLDKKYINAWHLDRDIIGGARPKVIHPFYHFQNGGHKLEDTPVDTGGIVFTGAPRIPHPPMDIILGIHFIINNFFNRNSNRNIDNLLINGDYISIVERAQKRMWEPYYNAFSSGVHTDYTVNKITPLYTL